METNPRPWIVALRSSHDRLAGLVRPLDTDQVRAQSYDKDWSVAQVLSHLGSGAAISQLMLAGALGRTEPPGREQMAPIWDQWNAKSPDEQAADALVADESYVRELEGLSDAELAAIKLSFIGMDLAAAGLVRLRVSEHALHTWDVAVTFDPAAQVAPDAVALLVDNVPEFIVPRLGKAQPEPFSARITTAGPARDYLLTTADKVTMTDWPGDHSVTPDAALAMPAEALIRLSYGRLDPDHTPADVQASPADLDRLRAIFPGF